MFEMQSVLPGPKSSKRQVAALAAFFHLTVATALLLGTVWRIESVEAPNLFEAFLPVAFLPAEWSSPLPQPVVKPPVSAPAKAPEIVQPRLDEIPALAPPTMEITSPTDSGPAAPISDAGPGVAVPGDATIAPAGGPGPEMGSVVYRPDMIPPRILFRLDPKYPEVARAARRQGSVVVQAEIGTDGALKSAQVVSAPLGFGLEQSALEAIGAWRFAPARYGDRPIAVYYRWNIVFSLR
jgi:protein TonB